jgi:hypothetical protein
MALVRTARSTTSACRPDVRDALAAAVQGIGGCFRLVQAKLRPFGPEHDGATRLSAARRHAS